MAGTRTYSFESLGAADIEAIVNQIASPFYEPQSENGYHDSSGQTRMSDNEQIDGRRHIEL